MSEFLKNSLLKMALLGLWITVLALAAGLPARAEKGDLEPADGGYMFEERAEPISKILTVTLGKAEVVPIDGEVSDVLVADPSIVDVQAIQANRLYVVGTSIGDTNIITLDAQGDVLKKLDVHVTYDLGAVQAMIDRLFPKEKVKVGSVHDQIMLTGTVSTPDVANKISSVAARYVGGVRKANGGTTDQLVSNLLEVRGEQQVMLQVKIVEASRSVLKELGVQTNLNDPNELAATTIFGTNPPGSSEVTRNAAGTFLTGGGIAATQDPAGIGRILADTGINAFGTLGIFLNALEEENLLHVLAEPNLTAVSGEQAGFLAGGEFPVPVGRDQVGNVVIEFREFGVSLNFKPVVLSDKRISLQMNTEVSSLDFDNAIPTGDITVPGLDVRRAETTVEIPSGGSLMIAGLLQSEALKGMSGLPGIRKTPVLGDLVKSDSFQRNETELVVIVTPILVEPYDDEERAEQVPSKTAQPLASMFADNLRRKYAIGDESIFQGGGNYGYLLN